MSNILSLIYYSHCLTAYCLYSPDPRHAYVNMNMTKRSLPPTVMPQLNQLDEDGRGDLKRAISKFGGVKHICDKAGLIPIKTWLKFEPISVKDA